MARPFDAASFWPPRVSGVLGARCLGQPLEEVRRGSAVAEAFIETVCAVPVQPASGFDARAGGVLRRPLRRLDEHVADAAAAVGLVDHEGRDPTPGAIVVRHWHQEARRGPDEHPGVVSDKHIGPRIRERAFEASMEFIDCLLVAQLVEQASDLIGVLESSRANGHCGHLDQSMNARPTMLGSLAHVVDS